MTQIFNKMTKAVASGGETLDNFAKASGVSAEEFARTWENNPSKALSMFVKGLSNTEGGAKGVLKALDAVGIKGIREADTIRRMANNHKVLDDALRTGAKGWKENTALTNEAAIRYETMGSKLKVLKNTFINFLRTIGEAVAPIVSKLADVFTGLFKHLQGTNNFTKITIAVFGALAIAIPPLIILTGLLAGGIVNIANAMIFLNKLGGGAGILAGMKKGFTGLLSPITQVASKIPLIGSAMTLLTGPVGIAIAAIVAIGTAFVIAYKKSETFRTIVNKVIQPVIDGFKRLWGVAKSIFKALGQLLTGNTLPTVNLLSKIMPKETAVKVTATLMQIRQVFIDVFNAVWQFGQDIGKKLRKFWDENGAMIMQALDNIWQVVVAVFTEIKNFLWPILQALGGVVKTVFMNVIVPAVKIGMKIIWEVMKFVWPLVKLLVVDTWNNIKNIINGALDIILGIVKIFGGLFTGQWRQVWNGVKQVFSGMLVLIWNLVQLWFVGKILKVVKIFGGLFKNVITSAFNGVKGVINVVLRFIWQIISSIFKRILSLTRSIFNGVFNVTKTVWNSVRNVIVTIVKAIYNSVKNIFTTLKNVIHSIFSSIRNFANSVWNYIKNKVVGYVRALYNSVRNIFNTLAAFTRKIFNGIRSFLGSVWRNIRSYVTSVVRGMYNNIRRLFNTLNSFTRGLFNRLKSFLANLWRSIKNTVTNHVKNMWASVHRTFNALNSRTRSIFNGVKNFMSKTWSSIKDKTVGTVKSLWSSVKQTFNNMNNGLKGIIGKIKGHINGMVTSVKKGLNKLIDGINWVAGKIGMDKLPKLSTGTVTQTVNRKIRTTSDGRLKQDTMAIVGDKGKGNGPRGFRHETITYPNGKQVITPNTDTVAYLPKNSSVDSGMATYQRINSMPRFAGGTKKKSIVSGFFENMSKAGGKMLNATGNKVGQGIQKAKDTGSKVAKNAGKMASGAVSAIGDVMDYIDDPGKLVDKIIGAFGFNFDFAKGSLIKSLLGAAYKKLKTGVKDLFAGWLEDSGGGDDSLLTRYPMIQPFGRYRGGLMFNGGRHYGVDFAYPYGADVYATNNGTVSSIHDYGGGLIARLLTGQFTLFFMHLSKILKTGKVKTGDKIAKSGNSGNFTTGPHLHFQVNRGHDNYVNNANAIEPMKWLAGHGGGGGKKSPSKWRSTIVRAAKKMKVSLSGGDINDVIRLIQTESGGNAGITQQIQDVNSGGNEAQGLLQYTPGTFNGYKLRGHGNIRNGYDQLLAFFNNSNWRGNLSAWKNRMAAGLTGWGPTGSRRFATGGLIKSAGWYNLAEGGHPEWVIPTDPSRKSDAMKLLALAANDIQRNKSTNNKRPKQLSNNINTGNNDALLLKMIEQQQQQINLLMEIAKSNAGIEQKDFNPSIDKYEHKQQVFNAIDDYNRQKARRQRF